MVKGRGGDERRGMRGERETEEGGGEKRIPGEDIVRNSRNAILIPQLQTQRQHERSLARSHWPVQLKLSSAFSP